MELRFEDLPLVSRLSPAPIALPITWTKGGFAALLGFGATFFWSCAWPSLLNGVYTMVSLAEGFFDLEAPALLLASFSYAIFSAFCRFSSSALYFLSLFYTSGQLGYPQ